LIREERFSYRPSCGTSQDRKALERAALNLTQGARSLFLVSHRFLRTIL
jgi:hypothetical protein